jgi:hypothetical protein
MSELLEAVKAALRGAPERDAEGVFTARFVFEASFPAFQGHFPGDPVLPGIVQLMAGACLAGAWFGHIPEVRAARNAKFTAPVRPGDVLTLRARPLPVPAQSPEEAATPAGTKLLGGAETCAIAEGRAGAETPAGAEVRASIGETPAASFILIFRNAHA